MIRKYYDLSKMETLQRKELFETDPTNYVYSTMHEIVDRSYDLLVSHEKEISPDSSFHEILPYEVLTQLLNFMSGIYDIDTIFEQVKSIEQMIREEILLRKIQ